MTKKNIAAVGREPLFASVWYTGRRFVAIIVFATPIFNFSPGLSYLRYTDASSPGHWRVIGTFVCLHAPITLPRTALADASITLVYAWRLSAAVLRAGTRHPGVPESGFYLFRQIFVLFLRCLTCGVKRRHAVLAGDCAGVYLSIASASADYAGRRYFCGR